MCTCLHTCTRRQVWILVSRTGQKYVCTNTCTQTQVHIYAKCDMYVYLTCVQDRQDRGKLCVCVCVCVCVCRPRVSTYTRTQTQRTRLCMHVCVCTRHAWACAWTHVYVYMTRGPKECKALACPLKLVPSAKQEVHSIYKNILCKLMPKQWFRCRKRVVSVWLFGRKRH